MNCPSCGQDNPEGARFCMSCAAGLHRTCASCGAEAPPASRFCIACAAPLQTTAPNAGAQTTGSSPTPAQPASFAGGRYEVKKFLGEGGKKQVYLAYDTILDRDVAFALVKTQGLDEAARARITREARAMGRLGDHPHIMPIYDLGQESGQPFMVLPLMAGGDVEGLVKKAPERRIPLGRALEITAQVCRGLQFAHAQGIVHRDLKPGNVWLTADGTAKIGDFGLALPLDRPRMTIEGMMVGTVDYMPPEQALGGEVTPRADLYSLGAMLYEMVTGRPPFLGDDAVAIIGQHINTPPVAPTWHNGQCPRPLEALVLRLLAKDPAQRPESAADVLAALEAIDLTEIPPGPPLQRGDGGISDARALEGLAGGVFVGRQREMGELKACLEDALSGRGRLAMLVGEPGIGKTRTAQELATYAGLRQCQVLWGRCYEGQGAPPYWPWVQAIRSYVRDHEDSDLRSQMGSGAADIAEIVSDVKERLPDLKPPPQLEPEQARFRLFDSIAGFLKGASRKQPLVVVLDDLHWADKPSLALLEFVARELGTGRVLLLGTYRDVELSRQHPLAETLGDLTKERLFQKILLRGLSQEDVARFLEITTGAAPPRGLVQAVYTHTEGNPLFVTEVVRLLVQEGGLAGTGAKSPLSQRGVGGISDSWTVRIPEGVREVIGRRLNRLSQRCNETLTIASVIGREFSLEQLKPLIEDMTEDRLLEVLEEALAARVIDELPRTVGRYQFSHALIQETLAGELSTTRKVRLHARIAQILEELYGANAEAHAAELARHFAEAEAVLGTEKLVHYSLLAGEKALASYGWEEALAHFQRGLTARGVPLERTEPVQDAEEAALLCGFGQAQLGTHERSQEAEPIASLSRAFEYYAISGDARRAIKIAAYSHFPPNAGGEIISKALELVLPDSDEAGWLLSRYIMPVRGDYAASHNAFQQAMAIAKRRNDPDLEMQSLVAAACVDFSHYRFDTSLDKNLQAIRLAERVDQPSAEAHARYDLMHVLFGSGDLEGAASHASAMLEPGERTHMRRWQVAAMEVNQCVCSARGDWEAARGFSEQGLAISPRDTSLLADRAILEYQVGNFDAGENYLNRMAEIGRQGSAGITGAATFFQGTFTVPAVAIPMVALISGVMRWFDVAEAIAKPILSWTEATPAPVRAAQIGLALIAVHQGSGTEATVLYDALAPISGMMSPQSPHGPGLSSDRLLGRLSQTMGNLDKAAQHFEDALSFCRKAGFRPELAWTCCDYADTLLARASTGSSRTDDKPRAMSLLDESLAISSQLGMKPLMQRVLSRREILRA